MDTDKIPSLEEVLNSIDASIMLDNTPEQQALDKALAELDDEIAAARAKANSWSDAQED